MQVRQAPCSDVPFNQFVTSCPSVAGSSGGGFFDGAVGSQFANRSESRPETPKKAASRKAAPTASASGMVLAAFSGSQYKLRSFYCRNVFLLADLAFGLLRNKSRFALYHAFVSQVIRWPFFAGGGGFFDSAVGSQFASRSETKSEAAPKKAAPIASASGNFLAVF